jgi:hypothetical protein
MLLGDADVGTIVKEAVLACFVKLPAGEIAYTVALFVFENKCDETGFVQFEVDGNGGIGELNLCRLLCYLPADTFFSALAGCWVRTTSSI